MTQVSALVVVLTRLTLGIVVESAGLWSSTLADGEEDVARREHRAVSHDGELRRALLAGCGRLDARVARHLALAGRTQRLDQQRIKGWTNPLGAQLRVGVSSALRQLTTALVVPRQN